MIRTDRDPATEPIAAFDNALLMRCYKFHATFVKKSPSISSTASPSTLSTSTKFDDWNPMLINFLHTIPDRDGVPLDYVTRDNSAPDRAPRTDILIGYALQAPLEGDVFNNNSAEVHTYITKLSVGNITAESKVQANALLKNGQLDYFALRDHYLGVGINSIDIIKAEHLLDKLFYSGEKKHTCGGINSRVKSRWLLQLERSTASR